MSIQCGRHMTWLLSVFGYPGGNSLRSRFKLGEKFFGTDVGESHIFSYFFLIYRAGHAPKALVTFCNTHLVLGASVKAANQMQGL